MPHPAPLREAITVYAGVLAACGVVAALGGVPVIGDHPQLVVGAIFLVVALEMAHRDQVGPERLGLGLGGLLTPSAEPPDGPRAFAVDLARSLVRALPSALREAAVALAIAAVVFPPFVVGWLLWHGPERAFELEWPPHAASFVAGQLVAVALPEEAFFRGYLQTRLSDALGSPRAIALQAALFAVIHVAFEPHPARLAVFFPALVFGMLRRARGGIGAAIVFHAACNVLSELLWRGFS